MMATTMMSVQIATEKDSHSALEDRLRDSSADLSALRELYSRVWEVIRRGQLYAGQPQNFASTRSLALARLALSTAIRSQDCGLIGDAHRMIAYSLNANEQFADSVGHYLKAIAALEFAGEFSLAARTRLGLVAALFMSGQYGEAMDAARTA